MTPAPPPPDGDDVASGPEVLLLAAGGVVVDRRDGTPRVLVVHRPAYDDWSLPKGHVDAGEATTAAALREVAEETGVAAHIIGGLGATEYPVGPGRKRVHWFLMEPLPDAAEPAERTADLEVDVAMWWDAETAAQRLTHPEDRALVREALVASPQDIV
jgi:8-oxo-dGTP diphosphatase